MFKSFVLILSLVASTFSFAETCFKAVNPIPAGSSLPDVVCINSFGLNLVDPGFPEAPYYSASAVTSVGEMTMKANLKKSSKAPYDLVLQKTFVSEGGNCDSVYRSLVSVNFKVDENGKTILPSLKVSGLIGKAHDSCEDRISWEQLEYQKL
jgi:hypothetical protein